MDSVSNITKPRSPYPIDGHEFSEQ